MLYEPTEAETAVHGQVVKLLRPFEQLWLAQHWGTNPEVLAQKARGKRPWSRKDLYRVEKLTGTKIRFVKPRKKP